MKDKSSVTLKYEQTQGLLHVSDLQNLAVSTKYLKMAEDICDDITKATKKYSIRLWWCVLMPVGLVIMILCGIFVSSPWNFLCCLVGLCLVVFFPIMTCFYKSKKTKTIQKLISKFREKSDGILNATANYETHTTASKSGLRTYRVIGSLTVSVKPGYMLPTEQASLNTPKDIPFNSYPQHPPNQFDNTFPMNNPGMAPNQLGYDPQMGSNNGYHHPVSNMNDPTHNNFIQYASPPDGMGGPNSIGYNQGFQPNMQNQHYPN